VTASIDWRRSPEVASFGGHRDGSEGDAIDGALPSLVLEPTEPAQVAAALAWASRERLHTVVRGHGSKLSWGRPPARVDLVLSTARLNHRLEHRHGDLTATVDAGMTLADFNRRLALQGQWLPLDTPFMQATIGGLVATNDSGPLRHRYGTPRDLLIGMTLALTDGALVKSGGHVVKNVAGYDLAKLMSGSFGTLAVIVDATFKLLPIPATARTLVTRYREPRVLAEDVATLAGSQLEPVALDVRALLGPGADDPRCELAVRFATSPQATRDQLAGARALLREQGQELEGEAEGAWWAEQVRRPWGSSGTTVRLSWMPAALAEVFTLARESQQTTGTTIALTARGGLGAGCMCIDGDDRAVTAVITGLRASRVVTNVVVLRHSGSLKQTVDVWGEASAAAVVQQSLKRAFDPAGILNAGRGPF
jgi:glycolate oxidase FAD binding subunit